MDGRTHESKRTRKHERTTFLPAREVLRRAQQSLEQAHFAASQAGADDPRAELLLASLDRVQSDLAKAVARFIDAAPEEVLREHTQYAQETPSTSEPAEPPADLADALRTPLALLGRLEEQFDELARSAAGETAREAYANLAELIAGSEKRISTVVQGGRDL